MFLGWSDWCVIAAYFLVTLLLGLRFVKASSKNLEGYILGGRDLPWWVAGISMVATTFAADTPLAVTELVAKNGISGNWLWWNMLTGGMLTVFFFSKLWRRSGVKTEVELITLRYGGKAAHILRVFRSLYLGLFMNVLILGWVNLAFMTILGVFFGLNREEQLFWTLGVMIITTFYTSLSGLLGVAYTDAIQFIIAMVGCIYLAIRIVSAPAIGGLEGLVAKLPPQTLDFFPDILGSNTAGSLSITLGSFIIFAGIQWWASWYPGAEPGGGGYVAQRMMSTRTEKGSLFATLFFQVAHYALRPWPWILVALATLILYPNLPEADYKLGYVYAMRDYLPEGWRGLLLAAFLGAYMSTLSTQLNWGAGYLINDAWVPLKKLSPDHPSLVWMSRLTVVALMFLSLFSTYWMNSITQVWEFILQCGAGLGLVLILRWYWWRINVWSEVSATLIPFLVIGVLYLNDIKDFETVYFWTASLTTVGWILITYLTPPENHNTLTTFWNQVKPEGAWQPITGVRFLGGLHIRQGIVLWILSIIMTYAMLFAIGKFLLGFVSTALVWTGVAFLSAFILYRYLPVWLAYVQEDSHNSTNDNNTNASSG